MITESRLLRIEEAAVYANVGVSYIRKLIKTRRLKAIRSEGTGRYYLIKLQDVDACLESLEPKRTK
ncbi:MAG TPA: excisionase family DNA-binding protein [Candidatus Polarisedimenticolia bacterium]|nr:excisionase family DNA-binding protein [Candidatus Polarisedimenticolia bacterium]